MGSLIGGVIGGIGSMFGASQQASAADQAAAASRLGFDYITSGPGSQYTTNFLNAGNAGVTGMQGVTDMQAQLLGVKPVEQGTTDAFNKYLDSTGYQFQLQQGTNALTSSAAAKGLLNSGATAKALTEYGQNLGAQGFNNYLTQLGGVGAQYAGQAQLGQNALGMVAGTGSTAGSGVADAYINKGNALAGGWSSLATNLGSGIASLF